MYQRPLYNQTSRCMAVLLLKTRTGANKVDIYTDNNDGRVVGGGCCLLYTSDAADER